MMTCDMGGMMPFGYAWGIFGALISLLAIIILIFLAIYLYQKITEKKRK